MKSLRSIVTELVVLSMLAVALGLGANAVRASAKKPGVIKLTHNYFKTPPKRQPKAADRATGATIIGVKSPDDTEVKSAVEEVGHIDSPYTIVSVNEAAEVFRDPNTALGVNVFVDARGDGPFAEGHIPGAVQCDHYNLDLYVDNVLDYAQGADKVIVYCNGGDCIDSMSVCTDLEDAGVSIDNIYLFAGGWKAWLAAKLPVATGSQDGGN